MKTHVVHVDDGFNFLGFESRRLRGTLLAQPQKDKVLSHLAELRDYLRQHKQVPEGAVIRHLNPKTRGWSNYYRHCAAKRTFVTVSHHVWEMLWNWTKRRHPKKPRKWVRKRYFREDGYWTFTTQSAQLYRHSATTIMRHTKVIGTHSPINPELCAYWEQRKRRKVALATFSRQRREMLRTQDGRCGLCAQHFSRAIRSMITTGCPGMPAATMTSETACLRINGAIMRIISARGIRQQRLESYEGRPSRTVLRGRGSSNVALLPGWQAGTYQPIIAISKRCG